jgi:hypothetical protein
MKPNVADLITFPRACAAIFSVGGTCWAMVVGLAMLVALASPKTGLLTMLYFLPGWIVYFGWMTIAKGDRPAPLSDRVFWLVSGIVNLAYFAHEFKPWNWLNGSVKSMNVAGYWWLFTGLLSLACCVVTKKRRADQAVT